jgi:hypothetical protein
LLPGVRGGLALAVRSGHHQRGMDTHAPSRQDRRPAFAAIALAAIGAFIVAAIAVHLLRPELDGTHAQLSVYLVGPWGALLQAGYVTLAVGIVALAIALYGVPPPPRRSAAPLLLFSIGAASLVVTSFAPMRFPGEELRLVHLIHGTSAQAAFLCTTTGMVMQAWRLRHAPGWRCRTSRLLAWAAACFLGVWVLALARELPRGLSQKVLVAMIVAWLAWAAMLLWRSAMARRGSLASPLFDKT